MAEDDEEVRERTYSGIKIRVRVFRASDGYRRKSTIERPFPSRPGTIEPEGGEGQTGYPTKEGAFDKGFRAAEEILGFPPR